MIYYNFTYDKNKYIIDLDFFLNLISEFINNPEPILNDLDITTVELDEFDYIDGRIYKIINDNEIDSELLTPELMESFKKYFINLFYDIINQRQNTLLLLRSLQYQDELIQMINKHNNYLIDRESVFLDILNSGDVNEIEFLESFLEQGPFDLYSLFRDMLLKSINSDSEMIKSDSIEELIINLVIYIDNMKYDTRSYFINKQNLNSEAINK